VQKWPFDLYHKLIESNEKKVLDSRDREEMFGMATRLPKTRSTHDVQSERAELAERLARFKPKTKLGVTLLTLSKKGLEEGEPLLDADGILKELGRKRYDE